MQMAGMSVVGRDHYGVFPLRGKLLNVREASHKQIKDNVKITSIKQILGLQQDVVYASAKSLRYGQLMIMTDQVSLSPSFSNSYFYSQDTSNSLLRNFFFFGRIMMVHILWVCLLTSFIHSGRRY